MAFSHQKPLMEAGGSRDVRQYIRFSEILLVPLDETKGAQEEQIQAVLYHTRDLGFTSIRRREPMTASMSGSAGEKLDTCR